MNEDIDSEIKKNREEFKRQAIRSYLTALIQSEIKRVTPFAVSLEILENISYEQALARILPSVCDVVEDVLKIVNFTLPDDIDVRTIAVRLLSEKNKGFAAAVGSMTVTGNIGIRVTDIIQKVCDTPVITTGIPSAILK